MVFPHFPYTFEAGGKLAERKKKKKKKSNARLKRRNGMWKHTDTSQCCYNRKKNVERWGVEANNDVDVCSLSEDARSSTGEVHCKARHKLQPATQGEGSNTSGTCSALSLSLSLFGSTVDAGSRHAHSKNSLVWTPGRLCRFDVAWRCLARKDCPPVSWTMRSSADRCWDFAPKL